MGTRLHSQCRQSQRADDRDTSNAASPSCLFAMIQRANKFGNIRLARRSAGAAFKTQRCRLQRTLLFKRTLAIANGCFSTDVKFRALIPTDVFKILIVMKFNP